MASSPPATSPSPSVALPPAPSPSPTPSAAPGMAPSASPSLTRELERAVARLVAGSLSRTSTGRCRSPRYRTLFAHSAGACAGRAGAEEAARAGQALLVASALTDAAPLRLAPSRSNRQPPSQHEANAAGPATGFATGLATAHEAQLGSSASSPAAVGALGALGAASAGAGVGGGALDAAQQQHEMTVVAAARAVWAIATTAEQVAMLSLQHIPNEEEEVLEAATSAECVLAAAPAETVVGAGAAFQHSARSGRRGSLLRPGSAPVRSSPASSPARRPRSTHGHP